LRVRHYSDYLLIGALVVNLSFVLLHVTANLLQVPLTIAMIAFLLYSLSHGRSMCDLCLLSTPVDTVTAVSRYDRRLKVVHFISTTSRSYVFMAIFIGSGFIVDLPYGLFIYAAVQLSFVYLLLSMRTHRNLQPWCPQCSGGGGSKRPTNVPSLTA
jgi:hypothetical protein